MAVIPNGTNIGDMLYWNGSFWVCLEPGTEGQLLLTQGIGAAPKWGELWKEGDYEAWVLKWSMTLTNGVTGYGYYTVAFYTEEINGIFYLWWRADSPDKNRFGTYNIVDHSVVFESPSDIDYLNNDPGVGGWGDYAFFQGCHNLQYSIMRSLQTYILLARYDMENIEVWREGSLLWKHDICDDTGESYGAAVGAEISLTGKYIMFFEYYSAKLWLYEGLSTILDTGTSTNVSETHITDSSKSWTNDEWVGKWVKVSTGNGQGYIAQITTNMGTILTCSGALFVTAGMVTSDEYKILDY